MDPFESRKFRQEPTLAATDQKENEKTDRQEPTLDAAKLRIEDESPEAPAGAISQNETVDRLKAVASVAWEGLSDLTQRAVLKAYEKVSTSDPVQNALDRMEIWYQEKNAELWSPYMGRVEKKHGKRVENFKVLTQQEAEGSAAIQKLQEQMQAAGMNLSSRALRQAEEGNGALRATRAREAQRTEITGAKLADVRGRYDVLKGKADAARARFDERLSAKQTENHRELAPLLSSRAQAEGAKQETQVMIGHLQAEAKKLLESSKTNQEGRGKGYYKDAIKKIVLEEKRLAKVVAGHDKVLQKLAPGIRKWEDRNRKLEAKKLSRKGVERALPGQAPQSEDSGLERRPARETGDESLSFDAPESEAELTPASELAQKFKGKIEQALVAGGQAVRSEDVEISQSPHGAFRKFQAPDILNIAVRTPKGRFLVSGRLQAEEAELVEIKVKSLIQH